MTTINTILYHPRRFSLILSFLVFCLYASTTPKMNVGYGDSDEFLTVASTWGLAHPPGYPLYVTALHIAMNLPLPGTTSTQRAHLVSGLCAATALYFITLLSFQLTRNVAKKKSNSEWLRLAAISTTTLVGATPIIFWTYAQIAEKYLFTAMFVSIIMYMSHLLIHPNEKQSSVKHATLLTLVYGLAFSHSQTMLFLFPYVLYVFYRTKLFLTPKKLIFPATALFLGLSLPLAILVIRNLANPEVSWPMGKSLSGLMEFVTKNDFRGEISSAYADSVTYFPKIVTLRQIINGSLRYGQELLGNYSWWVILPFAIALTHLWKKDKQLLIELALPTILIGFVQAALLNWPTDLQGQALVSRLYITSLVTVLPLLCIGILELFRRMQAVTKIMDIKPAINTATTLIIASVPIIIIFLNFGRVSLKDFSLTSELNSRIIKSLAQDSVITCYSDRSCASLIYEQTVNRNRPDVSIVTASGMPTQKKVNLQNLGHFSYDKNPWQIFDIVTWNVDKRPVYAVDLSSQYYTLFGVAQGFLFYVPMGYYGQLTHQIPLALPPHDMAMADIVQRKPINPNDYMQRLLVQSLEQTHFTNGSVFLAIGSRDAARLEVNQAVNLSYSLTAEDKKQALATRTKVENGSTNPNFAPGKKSVTSKELLDRIPGFDAQKKYSQSLKLALGAVTVDPTSVDARVELARVYMKLGDREMAKKESQNALVLDPKNPEALSLLQATTQ